MRFNDRTVIVTGGGSGIGRACALAFAREGALVTVADIDESGAAGTIDLLRAEGRDGRAVVTDVADAASVESLIAGTVAAHGRIDVLHNNAYWAPLNKTVVDTSEQEWDRTLAVTLKGIFLGCKYAIPAMIAGGGGTIVNTASTSAFSGSPAFAAYAAAKAGVLGLTRSVATDFGRHGIRCNGVAPGLIETPATVEVLADPVKMQYLQSRLLLGRHGQPSDIANAVLFLAGDESSFMTGQTILVDGGRMIA